MSLRPAHAKALAALALLTLAAAPTPLAAQTTGAYDGFFAGLDDGCRKGAAFEAWEKGLIARFVPEAETAPATPPPPEVAATTGEPTAVDKGEWVEVAAPAFGTWRGLRLDRIVFSFGKQNGIYGFAIEFREPAAAVATVFGAAVKRGKARMAKEYAETGASTGIDTDGRVALFCDFSN